MVKIDEAHERSIYTDLILGLLKKCDCQLTICLLELTYTYRIRRKRPSLRVIVSSATLDASYFLDYFSAGNPPDEATIVSLEGRMYPVEVAYLEEPTPDYVQKAAETAWNIHMQVCHLVFYHC